MNVMRRPDHFVDGGARRYLAAITPEISATVAAEFAERLAQVIWLKRGYLRFLMRRQIRRRIAAAASNLALY